MSTDTLPDPAELERRVLASLSPAEIDHVSLGLEHAFGALLCRRGATIVLGFESGGRVLLDGTLTVSDVWGIVQAATIQADTETLPGVRAAGVPAECTPQARALGADVQASAATPPTTGAKKPQPISP